MAQTQRITTQQFIIFVGLATLVISGCAQKTSMLSGGASTSSSSSASGSGGGSGGGGGGGGGVQLHTVKWNPGHYLASGTILGANDTVTSSHNNFLQTELNAMGVNNSIIGYRMLAYWSAFEKGQGQYDFTVLHDVINYMKTKYNSRAHLVLVVLPGSFTSTTVSGSMVPSYILSDSKNGPSPVSGSYGWWGGTGNGNTATAALYRPSVMARWVALHQALGAEFDGDPNFEGIMFQEDSWVMGAWVTNKPPDYAGDTTMQSMFKSLLSSTVAAFPHTNVIFQNTWLGGGALTQDLEQWMVQNRVAPSTADTFGQAYVDAHNGGLNSWGMNAYSGFTFSVSNVSFSGPDLRSKIPSMVDIEGPDLGMYQNMGGPVYPDIGTKLGLGGYEPQDICTALQGAYKASHAFWSWLGNGSNIPGPSQWNNVAAVAANCPMITKYPSAYP